MKRKPEARWSRAHIDLMRDDVSSDEAHVDILTPEWEPERGETIRLTLATPNMSVEVWLDKKGALDLGTNLVEASREL